MKNLFQKTTSFLFVIIFCFALSTPSTGHEIKDNNTVEFVEDSCPMAGFHSRKIARLTIDFTNTSVGAQSYLWDFGDGHISYDVNPTHTYRTPGIYTVKLVAFDGGGGCPPSIITEDQIID